MENITYEERKQALIEEITAAFDGVEREDGITFHEATAMDGGGFPTQRAAARALDTDLRWQDVPKETFQTNNPNLSFLDPKGFHYYLPALVIWYLRYDDSPDPDDWGWAISDHLIFDLAAGYVGELSEHYLSWFRGLTAGQARAIAHFLVFAAEHIDERAHKGIDRYWGQFL